MQRNRIRWDGRGGQHSAEWQQAGRGMQRCQVWEGRQADRTGLKSGFTCPDKLHPAASPSSLIVPSPFPRLLPLAVTTYKKRRPADGAKGASAQLFNFGPSHVPGWLPAGPGDAALSHLPAKSGMGLKLRCGRCGR